MNPSPEHTPVSPPHPPPRALIVDDERTTLKALGKLIENESAEPVFAQSGSQALDLLNTAQEPFAILITDQDLEGGHLQGTDLLELARTVSPNTIRFLTATHSDQDTIINAVNKGAVQRFIPRPWQTDVLQAAIHISLRRYARIMEKERLFTLARQQSSRLFTLTRDLMEATDTAQDRIAQLDQAIQALKTGRPTPASPEELQAFLATFFPDAPPTQEALDDLFSATLTALFQEMAALATKNGVELPPTLITGEAHGHDTPPADSGE